MAMTLVGVFDNSSDAQDATSKLEAHGIDRNMVKVTSTDTTSSKPAAMQHEDHRGFFAKLFNMDEPDEETGNYAEAVRRGSSVVTVSLNDDSKADEVSGILEDCGAIDVSRRVEAWKATGYKGYDPSAPAYSKDQTEKERQTLDVMEEQINVGKRTVEEGGVRVHRRVSEKPFSEQVSLHSEKAVVERHAVDREATKAEIEAFGKDGTDVTIRESSEEPVISKTTRVVEEVSVGKKSSDRIETVNDTVRRTDVDVEQLNANRPQSTPGMDRPQPTQQPPRR